ncbi:MAG: glycosyltransferase [Rhodospirillales bacterium]
MIKAHKRLLIYSHDSFGLGHLRRCRTIAHSLVDHRNDLSVLILSGSPIIGSFDFRSRVDFVRIPGVIKLRHGDYTSLNLDIDIEEILAMRASLIRHTAEMFDPDLFLVDKEPLGLRGEVKDTLTMLKSRGTPLVLGLRDVMDDPDVLAREWERKNAVPALIDLYDHIWIYGLPQICNPLEGVPLPDSVTEKIHYTGYLRRDRLHFNPPITPTPMSEDGPYLLVITGGGGDGALLIDWVLRAYEHDPDIPENARMVLGPFMRTNLQTEFMARVERLDKVQAITFDANVESLIANADGIVSMGGYNIFCEILSFDKPSLIVPRTVPRLEQYIRAKRALDLGLIKMLSPDGEHSPQEMAAALRNLSNQSRPSQVNIPGLLDGLSAINGMVDGCLDAPRREPARISIVK